MSSRNKLQGIESPLFSIIIPVYQNKDTLSRCVDSVLCQNEQNYEIILVDDGSTDESREICDEYVNQSPRSISVIHKQNQGPLLARIEGIRKARGEYLLFLDADDAYVDGILRKLNNSIKKQRADIVIFNYYRCDKNGKSELNKPLYINGQVFEKAGKQRLYEELIAGFQLNALWQKCVRREVVGELRDFLQYGKMIIGEDKLLSMEMLDRAEKIVYLADGLYNYSISSKSISHRLSLKHYKDMAIVYHRTLEYMEHWKMDNYKELCCMRKTEFGLSCLYSTASEVRIRERPFADFITLALYIVSDQEYWEAFNLCKKRLSFSKRSVCKWMRNKHIKMLFGLIWMHSFVKSVFRKGLR